MVVSPIDLQQLNVVLEAQGMRNFGGFRFEPQHLRKGSDELLGANGILIGNAGPDMWNVFSASSEFSDGLPNPMNRWTKRVLDNVANRFGERCIFPFDEPYWPFQRFLQSAAGLRQSPLGLFIHPEFGLWHALRGVLICSENAENAHIFKETEERAKTLIQHPCATCLDQPCLSACPVGAFDGENLNVRPCFKHLDSNQDPMCMELGCRARQACPVGIDHRYHSDQVRFHMKSYRY